MFLDHMGLARFFGNGEPFFFGHFLSTKQPGPIKPGSGTGQSVSNPIPFAEVAAVEFRLCSVALAMPAS